MGLLKIYMRQTPQIDYLGNNIYYTGTSPASMTPTTGTLPTGRQWPSYGNYIDVSGDVGNLQAISLTWTEDRNNEGVSTPGAYQSKKSSSGIISIEADTFFLLKKWLLDDISSPLNAVDVKIHDTGCNIWYEDYQIKNTDIIYCESQVCQVDLQLRQRDEQLNCIKTTLIDDNHLGWFPDDGKPIGKKHPRFAYCNEYRPVAQLVIMWKLASWTFLLTNTVVIPLAILINGIIGIINAIIWVINRFGANIDPVGYIDPGDIIDNQERVFVDAAGCNREHPAPLIRDYIYNVCKKCGIELDADSVPIFLDPVLKITTSTGYEEFSNPYIYACYWYNQNQRGIQRVDESGSFNPFRTPDFNDDEYWIKDNAPFLTLEMFLDKLKPVFNAEWRIYQGKLYFDRKDRFIDSDNYVFDFSEYGADRHKIVEGVCFEYDTVKVPASIKGLYEADAADTCGNEARKQYDSTVTIADATRNPLAEGLLDKTTPIGAAKFRCDGASRDYIYDACQQNVNSGFFTNLFGIWRNVMDEFERTYKYALLLKDHTATLPKIIIWDGVNYNSASALMSKSAYEPRFTPLPTINTRYNNYPTPEEWYIKHPPITFAQGNLLVSGYTPGYYTVRNFAGGVVAQQPAMLVNYDMYFATGFKGGLWDRFHWIDDPHQNPRSGQMWRVKIALCCEDLQRLGVNGYGQDVKLGGKVKLPRNYYPDGRIKEITLSYDPENEFGAYIEIKGD